MPKEEDYYLELLRKLLEGTLTLQERGALTVLVEADPDKRSLLQYLDRHEKDIQAELEAEIIYEKTLPNDLWLTTSQKKTKSFRNITRPLWYAVVAACFVMLFFTFWFMRKQYQTVENNEQWMWMITGKGERKFFRMNDGTEVWVNSESVLKVKKGYGTEHRIMELQGEAYFSVAKNKALPLHINVLNTEIEVLGTVFNVRAYPEEKKITTSLVEGKVKLHVNGGKDKRYYTLNPGEKIEITNKYFKNIDNHVENGSPQEELMEEVVDYKKIPVENEKVPELMWIENKLVFNGDSLNNMVKKMERWYNRTIIIQNEKLKNQVFTGVFQEPTCEQVLDLLQETGVKFSYKVEEGIIYLN